MKLGRCRDVQLLALCKALHKAEKRTVGFSALADQTDFLKRLSVQPAVMSGLTFSNRHFLKFNAPKADVNERQ